MDKLLEDIKNHQLNKKFDSNLKDRIIEQSRNIKQIRRISLIESLDSIFQDVFRSRMYHAGVTIACIGFVLGIVFSNSLTSDLAIKRSASNAEYNISDLYVDGGLL